MKTTTLLLFTIILNACGSSKASTDIKNNSMTQQTNPNGEYTISTLYSNKTNIENLTLNFDNKTKRVSGFSGCNTFFGNYTLEGSTITFKSMASTKKYCMEDENKAERAIMKALNETNGFKISGNNITLLNNKTELLSANKTTNAKRAQENIKIEYRAHTRGYLNKIVLENKTVSVQESHSVEPVAKPCSEEDWDALMQLVSAIDLKGLNTLEAPSKAFQYDGAAITNLTVYKDSNTYETPPFDSGKPNKEIETIVEMVLKIANSSKEKK
ncbi:MAG: META domain-containing protein [Lacinutrix sp.]|uniref:META domain-containing protein n=1 Tax=Lacinutrix sp. TaxID=1937692 RepID=UPI0030A39A0D